MHDMKVIGIQLFLVIWESPAPQHTLQQGHNMWLAILNFRVQQQCLKHRQLRHTECHNIFQSEFDDMTKQPEQFDYEPTILNCD